MLHCVGVELVPYWARSTCCVHWSVETGDGGGNVRSLPKVSVVLPILVSGYPSSLLVDESPLVMAALGFLEAINLQQKARTGF